MKKVRKTIVLYADMIEVIESQSERFNLGHIQDEQIYEKVEYLPTFPGGKMALVDFLSKNIKYPSLPLKV